MDWTVIGQERVLLSTWASYWCKMERDNLNLFNNICTFHSDFILKYYVFIHIIKILFLKFVKIAKNSSYFIAIKIVRSSHRFFFNLAQNNSSTQIIGDTFWYWAPLLLYSWSKISKLYCIEKVCNPVPETFEFFYRKVNRNFSKNR